MEFHTFYDYFLYTKSWAYVMMFVVLPLYVLYWNFVLFPDKKKGNNRQNAARNDGNSGNGNQKKDDRQPNQKREGGQSNPKREGLQNGQQNGQQNQNRHRQRQQQQKKQSDKKPQE